MVNTRAFFATNRPPGAAVPGGYGDGMTTDPAAVDYVALTVTGTDIASASSGALGGMDAPRKAGFDPALREEIMGSAKNLLIFIHGFANSFEDAMRRAAFNRPWFANVRVFLLAHSMDNHALNGAVVPFMVAGAPPVTFDEVILAAADEFDDALEKPDHSGLFHLRDLARRISIYSSHRDAILGLLSYPINGYRPLGLDGAKSASAAGLFPPQTVRSVDCTMLFDLLDVDHSGAVEATHQYYRRSKRMCADVAALMANGQVTPGISSLAAPPW